ncbi:MAG: DUF1232 domain-containing protein [Spirochaetia bacterium]|nr:DUF1232 domain-containing protein [Spirochaetia bacterium]
MKTKTTNPFIIKQGVSLFKGLMDKRTPWFVKLIGFVILFYILLPFDFLTDFAPFLGWVDDITLATVGMIIIAKLIPREVLDGTETKNIPAGEYEEKKGN